MNYYEQLGLDRDATQEQIKSAYRKLAVKYHPDRNKGDKDAEQRFKQITVAYQTLSDPKKKSEYDLQLETGRSGRGWFTGTTGSDFFSQMYNSMFGGSAFKSTFQQFHTKRKPSFDINFTVQVSLDQAYSGCSKNISYIHQDNCTACRGTGYNPSSKFIMCQDCMGTGYITHPFSDQFGRVSAVKEKCQRCNGSGHRHQQTCKACNGNRTVKSTKTQQIEIPKGAFTDMVLTYSGYGKRNPQNGVAGNLNIILKVSQVSRDGKFTAVRGSNDIQTQIFVSYYDMLARNGKTHTVTLPDGNTVQFKIPESFQMDKLIRIKGKGMPSHPNNIYDPEHMQTGDLLIRVMLQIPQQIPPKAMDLLRQFQEILKQNR